MIYHSKPREVTWHRRKGSRRGVPRFTEHLPTASSRREALSEQPPRSPNLSLSPGELREGRGLGMPPHPLQGAGSEAGSSTRPLQISSQESGWGQAHRDQLVSAPSARLGTCKHILDPSSCREGHANPLASTQLQAPCSQGTAVTGLEQDGPAATSPCCSLQCHRLDIKHILLPSHGRGPSRTVPTRSTRANSS